MGVFGVKIRTARRLPDQTLLPPGSVHWRLVDGTFRRIIVDRHLLKIEYRLDQSLWSVLKRIKWGIWAWKGQGLTDPVRLDMIQMCLDIMVDHARNHGLQDPNP
jgi:hypothetical protein